MKESQIDIRVKRTKNALRRALLELMVEQGYERLSVQEILDRADVGRATFYLHYRSKEDLLCDSLNLLREQLVSAQKLSGLRKDTPPEKSAHPLGFSLAFLQHVHSHRQLYRSIVGRESGAIVEKQIRRLLAELVREEFASNKNRLRSDVKVELAVHYIVGAFISIVTWWLDYNIQLTPQKVDSLFRQMTLPALKAIQAVK